jgi:hypothetical protein
MKGTNDECESLLFFKKNKLCARKMRLKNSVRMWAAREHRQKLLMRTNFSKYHVDARQQQKS